MQQFKTRTLLSGAVLGLASLIAAVVTGVVILVQRYADAGSQQYFDGRPRGKGPYVTGTGKPRKEIVRALGTSDPKIARRRVHEEWAALDREFGLDKREE